VAIHTFGTDDVLRLFQRIFFRTDWERCSLQRQIIHEALADDSSAKAAGMAVSAAF
jgi:hypothetical protein